MNEGRHSTNSKSAWTVIRLALVMCIGVMCYVICSSRDVFFVPTVAIRPNSSSDGLEPKVTDAAPRTNDRYAQTRGAKALPNWVNFRSNSSLQ